MVSTVRIDPRRTVLACALVALSSVATALYNGDPRSLGPLLLVMAACVVAGAIAGSYRAVPAIVIALYVSGWAINGMNYPTRTDDVFVQVVVLSVLLMSFFAALIGLGIWLSHRRSGRP